MPPKRASRAKANKGTDTHDVVMEGAVPEVAVESTSEESNHIQNDSTSVKAILQRSVKRTRELFAEDQENLYAAPLEEQASQRVKLQSKIYDEYKQVQVLPYPLLKRQQEQLQKKKTKGGSVATPAGSDVATGDSGIEKILDTMPKKTQQFNAL
ncbi:hypothetical protein BC939DRAFT_533807, partial [Gamsiella multidivaricata]|uniref:uncharacterized protein n=1 Tax=Gamsiella multidivaricata TaxID=101098 RepID=UPI00221FC074